MDERGGPVRRRAIIDGEEHELDIRLAPLAQRFRLRARHVLNDADQALDLLEAANDMAIARIQYFALVALLRAVGHVLDKVDGSADGAVKKVASRRYREMKDDPDEYEIFFHFIEAERNLILKEYRSAAELTTPVPLLINRQGEESISEGFVPFPMFVFDDGPFAGEDARDVAPRAIHFWDEYLGEIELECFGESQRQDLRDPAD